MPAAGIQEDVDDLRELQEVVPSPFRAAFGRARVEAQSGSAPEFEHHGTDESYRDAFEVRLLRRRGKRADEEARWNALGRSGWELVGLTEKHAAFKRRAVSR